MNGVLVDSDVLIEVSRGRNSAMSTAWAALVSREQPEAATTAINIAELTRGLLPHEQAQIQSILDELTCFAMERENGELAGALMRRFNASHGLELPDALIASVALLNDLLLWTRNRKHFPMRELRFYEP